MNFLDALSNVTESRRIPPREEIEGLSWGIKRQLSMHRDLLPVVAMIDKYYFTLGDERFYDLMVYCCPKGRYRAKSAKKEKIPEPPFDDELRRRICEVYGAEPDEFSTLLELLLREGKDVQSVKADFGVAPLKKSKVKTGTPKRKRRKK